MRTKFYIKENKWFVGAYILKDQFPLPDGLSKEWLEEHVKEMNDSVRLDMYYTVDDYPIPLQLGDKVYIGNFDWRVIDKAFSLNTNTMTYTLQRG